MRGSIMPEKVERIAEIVERAFEVEGEERAKLIDELCGEDVDLCQEVKSLLGFDEKARELIDTLAHKFAAPLAVDVVAELRIGQVLGDYKILALLGEGGMGEVYLAEDMVLGRQVAIKLVKTGLGTSNIIRHFRKE